ncbi:extracellular solute-binding protein [Clostridium sp. MCC353]|uniref:sugar ABC transporter substrate-binding protein n=1 Tax=Clostridium sp. MCC353 TaxID=2592646 RepID=UPI001C009A14|nr:extracellular solute-binding protein [Clostridium sp. MCC353]
MKKILKKSVCGLLSGLLIMGTAGCSSQKGAVPSEETKTTEAKQVSSEAAETKKSEEKAGNQSGKNITVWIPSNFTESERDYYGKMLKEIDDNHEEFQLSISEQADLSNQLLSAIISNDLPDLTMSDGNRLGVFCHAGVFLPLDDYFTDEIKADLLPSVLDECTYAPEGKLYNIAQFDSGLALWANKSMLEEVGARIPTSYKEAWDKAEFEDICQKLKDKGYWALDVGQADTTGSKFYYTYLPVVKSFGGDWMDRDTMMAEGALNSEATIEAANYLYWMSEQGYINARADSDDGYYGKKDTAMLLYGHWMTPQVEELLGDDGILVPIPDFGHGVYSGSGSQTWGITVKAQENDTVEECAAILNELLKPEYVQGMSDANGSIPGRLSVLEKDPKYAKGGKLYLYREQLEGGIAINRPHTPAAVFVRATIGQTLRDILAYGNAEQAMNDITKEIDQLIEDNKYNEVK